MTEVLDTTKELETKGLKELLWIYALPAVISQIIASVYNIVDRIFLGQNVGALALAGLAITMPIMNIVHAFGSLVGAGSSARMSIVLGRKDLRWAEKILGNSVILTVFFGALFLTAGYLWMDPILHLFGASDATVDFAKEYMMIVLPGMFFTTVTFNLTGLIRASGYPTKSMWILVGGALLNILLDALFIPFLDMGIAGAAWATTISMVSASIVAIWHFLPKPLFGHHEEDESVREIDAKAEAHRPLVNATVTSIDAPMTGVNSTRKRQQAFVRFKRHCWEPKLYIFRNILAIGISPFSMNLAGSAVVALLNKQLIRFGGDMAVSAYGVVNSFASIILLVMLGLCQGMQPIAGYNYGAGHTDRLKTVYKLTMKVCIAIGVVGCLAVLFVPRLIISCFTHEAALMDISVPALRFMMVMAPLIGFTVTNSQFFQSIDRPWIAIVTSLSRQVLFLTPLIYLVPQLAMHWNMEGLTGVWLACTISDVLGACLSAVLLSTQLKVFRPGYVPPVRMPRKERGPKE